MKQDARATNQASDAYKASLQETLVLRSMTEDECKDSTPLLSLWKELQSAIRYMFNQKPAPQAAVIMIS